MTNADGKCYVFDSRGAGYARGEGVVSLILKCLDDAVRDGDKVHAIIRSSGLNQDGKTAGISLPNPVAQANLMRLVYRNAGLDPKDTPYVEAHGTGTQAGMKSHITSSTRFLNPSQGTVRKYHPSRRCSARKVDVRTTSTLVPSRPILDIWKLQAVSLGY